MRVNKDAILWLINGKWRIGIYGAFAWDETPQGYDFWAEQCANGLNLKGARALLEIVERAKCDGRLV